MTIYTAANKVDKLTINQLKHFIKLCDEGLLSQDSLFITSPSTVYRGKDLRRAKEKFQNELKKRGYYMENTSENFDKCIICLQQFQEELVFVEEKEEIKKLIKFLEKIKADYAKSWNNLEKR